MKKFSSVDEAVKEAVNSLGKDIKVLSPIGVGAGNSVLNSLAQLAKQEKIKLDVYSGLSLQVPSLPGLNGWVINPLFKRIYSEYTPFKYFEDCEQAKKEGKGIPKHLTYHSFYFFPGLAGKFPELQHTFHHVNFKDVLRSVWDANSNLVTCKVAEKDGIFNLGTNVDLTKNAVIEAKKNGAKVIGLVNKNMPFCQGEASLPDGSIDFIVEEDEPLFALPHKPLNAAEYAIGYYTSEIIPDGATLQIGIGQIADALAYWLVKNGKSDIYGYSEMISDAFMHLAKEGVITRRDANGRLMKGAFALGSKELYEYMHDNQDLAMIPVLKTNNVEYIRHLDKFHGVNTALQLDLFGQCASEGFFRNGKYVQYTGMGGQFEFQEACMHSPGGKSILTMRATKRDEKGKANVSNIVSCINGVVGIPRNKIDWMVTEYGARCLRDKTMSETAKSVIEIANSKYQNKLLHDAKKTGLIEDSYDIPKEFQNNTVDSLKKRFGSDAEEPYPLGVGVDIPKHATEAEMNMIRAKTSGLPKKLSALLKLYKERKK